MPAGISFGGPEGDDELILITGDRREHMVPISPHVVRHLRTREVLVKRIRETITAIKNFPQDFQEAVGPRD